MSAKNEAGLLKYEGGIPAYKDYEDHLRRRRMQARNTRVERHEPGRLFAVVCVLDTAHHVPNTMTVDDDLPAKRDFLKLSFAIAGLVWYSILLAIGLVGCRMA